MLYLEIFLTAELSSNPAPKQLNQLIKIFSNAWSLQTGVRAGLELNFAGR